MKEYMSWKGPDTDVRLHGGFEIRCYLFELQFVYDISYLVLNILIILQHSCKFTTLKFYWMCLWYVGGGGGTDLHRIQILWFKISKISKFKFLFCENVRMSLYLFKILKLSRGEFFQLKAQSSLIILNKYHDRLWGARYCIYRPAIGCSSYTHILSW